MIKCPHCGREGGPGMTSHIQFCNIDPAATFWKFVQKGEGCWLWTAAKHRDGYGRANDKQKKKIRIAHRVAWELTNGPIPEGMDVCHTCDVRLCCNPAHLFLGTHDDNMHDMTAKGRRVSKLTIEQVREIRRIKAATGVRNVDLAKQFNVSQSHVAVIIRGEQWKRAN